MAGDGRVNNHFRITMTRMITLVPDEPLILLGSNHGLYMYWYHIRHAAFLRRLQVSETKCLPSP